VGTRNGLFYDTDASMTTLSQLENHVADSATCRLTDRQGHVWTGTFGRGVFVNGRQLLTDDINSSRINDIKMIKTAWCG
jgi:ligand-binding sensor domain-containing protein